MLSRKRSSKSGSLRDRKPSLFSSFSLSRIAIAGICLLIAQLVVVNVVIIAFEAKTNTNEIGSSSSWSTNGNAPSRNSVHLYSQKELDSADGIFHGFPVYFRENQKNVETLSHCVGENYQDETSWQKRSCEFSDFFCFDTVTKEYVVFDKTENERVYKHAETQQFVDISQSFLKKKWSKPNTMSIGGINLKWADDIPRLEWFPEIRVLKDDETLSYYELPPSVVMIPFHSLNGGNPGHLVWDDFLPIYNLLKMYQLMNESTQLMMMRYILKDPQGGNKQSRGLWASCDWTDEKKAQCKKMFKKFLPLMLGSTPIYEELPTTENFDFRPKDATHKSNLICAKHGVAGIGPLTDHGTSKLHGWDESDYQLTQNHGRGGLLYEFRNFMLTNLGIPAELSPSPPFRIIFSEKSSSIGHRNFDFSRHKALLEKSFHPSYVSVESYVFSEMSVQEQLEVTSQASIFITGCGGGAVTSMFMPRGSSVIMYYLEDGSAIGNKLTGKPARLDWDLFNNLAYLKVHWLPAGTMSKEYDVKALLLLIQHELEGLIRERSYDHFFS